MQFRPRNNLPQRDTFWISLHDFHALALIDSLKLNFFASFSPCVYRMQLRFLLQLNSPCVRVLYATEREELVSSTKVQLNYFE